MPTVTAVSPTAVPVGNFSITVTGTKFVDGAKVMLGGQALTTKFVSSTQLTASGTTTASQKDATVQVTVTNPDPGSMASAGLMVKIGVPPTTVAITPTSVQLHPGETVQFKAVVSKPGSDLGSKPCCWWKFQGGNDFSQRPLYGPECFVDPGRHSPCGQRPERSWQLLESPGLCDAPQRPPLLTAVLPTPIPVGNFTISVSGSNFLSSTTTGNAIQNGQTLAAALATGTPLVTQFPQNSYFASQLQQVAQIIQVRSALGLQHQIFFVSMGGFDTHTGQLHQQDSLFNDLNASLSAFYQATVEMGVASTSRPSRCPTWAAPGFPQHWHRPRLG